MNRRIRFLSKLTSFLHTSERGEIATTAVLIGIGVIALGIVVSRLMSQQPGDQDTRSMAANAPTVPNCYDLTVKDSVTKQPTTALTVGKSYDLVANFFVGQTYNGQEVAFKGEFFLDSLASNRSLSNGIITFGAPINVIRNYAIIWTPTASDIGNHTISCRAWNGNIAECRPASETNNPPQYTCDGPTSQVNITVAHPPMSCSISMSNPPQVGGQTYPITPVVSGGSGSYTYSWKAVNGVTSTIPYGTLDNPTAQSPNWTAPTDPAGGTLGTIDLTVTDSAGGTCNHALMVQVLSFPTPTPTNTPVPTIVPCTDSDGGQVFETFGQVVQTYADGNTVTYNDACQLTGMIRETYCDASGVARMQDFSCPSGLVCPSGTGSCVAPTPQTLPLQVTVQNPNAQYNVFAQASVPGDGRVCGGGRADTTPQSHSCLITSDKAWSVDVWAEGPAGVIKSQETQSAPIVIPAGGPYTQQNFTIVLPGSTPTPVTVQCGQSCTQASTCPGGLCTAGICGAGPGYICSAATPADPVLTVSGDGGDGTYNLPGDTITVAVQHSGLQASSVQKFDVKVYNSAGGLVDNGITMNAIFANGVSSATGTLPASIFTAGGTYKLKAGAYSSGNTLPDLGVSADVPITVSLPASVCANPITAGPSGLTPADGTTINAGPQNIRWGAVTGAGQYAIRINEDPEADGIWKDASGNQVQNCSQAMAGNDKCIDNTAVGGTLTSFPYTFVAGKTYKIWVHALSTDTACQDASHTKDGWGVYTTSTITAGAPGQADLTTTAASISHTTNGINSVQLAIPVKNVGNAVSTNTGVASIGVNLKTAGASVCTGDVIATLDGINPGQARNSNVSLGVTFLTNCPGFTYTNNTSYDADITIDSTNKVTESNETNNTVTYTFIYGSSSTPSVDLHVKSTSHTEPATGLDITTEIENLGNSTWTITQGSPFDIGYTLSDGTNSCTGSFERSSANVSGVVAGGGVLVKTHINPTTVDFTCTPGVITLTQGTSYTLTTLIDSTNKLVESNENNNSNTYTFTYGTGTPGGKPDLHLKSSSHTESGTTISLTSVVENLGTGAVSIPSATIYDMKFTVSDGTSTCYTSILKTEVRTLGAGQSVSVVTPVDLSAAQWMCTAAMTFTTGKTYTVTTDVDPLNVVAESDESNNADGVYTFTFGSGGTTPIPTNGFSVTVNAPNGGEQLVAGTATTISWRARTTTAADVGQYDTIIRVNYDKVGGGTSHWTLCGEGTAPACPKSNVTGSAPGGTVTYSWTPTKAEIPANAKPATYKARVVLMPPTGYPPAQLKKDSNGFSYLDSDSSNAAFDIVDAGTVTNTPIPTLTGTTPAPGGTCQVTTNFDSQGGLTSSSPYTFNNTGDTRRLEVNATLADGRTVERICFTLAGGSGYARDDIWDGYIISTDDNCESVTTSDNTPDTRIYAVNPHTGSNPYSTLIMDVAVAQSGGYVRCTAERYFKVNPACGYDQQKGGDFNCDGTANKSDINFGKTLLKMLIRGAQATLGGFTRGELEELIAALQRK